MAFLPCEDFTFRTPLSSAEVERKLLEITEPKTPMQIFLHFFMSRKTYLGIVKNSKFQIIWNQDFFRKFFLPVIDGTIKPYLNGSSVEVKMRMYWSDRVKITLLLGLAAFTGVSSAINFLSNQNDFTLLIISWTAVILVYSLSHAIFKHESKKQILYLRKYLKANNP